MSQECKNQFDEIKKGKKHRYVVFYIEDEKMIKVECVGDRDASYDSFLNDIMKGGEGELVSGAFHVHLVPSLCCSPRRFGRVAIEPISPLNFYPNSFHWDVPLPISHRRCVSD